MHCPPLSPQDLSIEQALAAARSRGLDTLDAQLLLLHALDRRSDQRSWLRAHADEAISGAAAMAFRALQDRRLDGEPVAYILERREFYGLELDVDQRVLVPRPETEVLVEWALEWLKPMRGARVLDLGTGSGAIALALKSQRPDLELVAVDASGDALEVARANSTRLELDVSFLQGSWMSPVAGYFDLIVANPPYIRDDDPHLATLRAEPVAALSAGADGLADLRLIVAGAVRYLRPAGRLMVEHGHDQAEAVRGLMQSAAFDDVQTRSDLAGIGRCCSGRWPGEMGGQAPSAAVPGAPME